MKFIAWNKNNYLPDYLGRNFISADISVEPADFMHDTANATSDASERPPITNLRILVRL